MSILLVVTVGRTDVQLVDGGQRWELGKERTAAVHDALENGAWTLVDAPLAKGTPPRTELPSSVTLCTPRLDAVLRHAALSGGEPLTTLVLETRRAPGADREEPRMAGQVVEARLQDRGPVYRVAYLTDNERLEDRSQARDAIIRRAVVERLDSAIRERCAMPELKRIIVASTGGLPGIGSLVDEIVHLHAPFEVEVERVEVADGAKASPPTEDQVVDRLSTPEPAESYRARRRALDMIHRGDLLAAWGAVQHLHGNDVEQRWTKPVKWLALFAAAMPLPTECDLDILRHPRMAVRAALRVEFALRAGDVPRAVHGTVAFFEAAFWDRLRTWDFVTEGFVATTEKHFTLLGDPTDEQRKRFWGKEGRIWKVKDNEQGVEAWLPRLNRPSLTAFWLAIKGDIRDLRNDVAHNEPTPERMESARRQMEGKGLWSAHGSFLAQPLVQDEMQDYGLSNTAQLCEALVGEVRSRLLAFR